MSSRDKFETIQADDLSIENLMNGIKLWSILGNVDFVYQQNPELVD